MFKKINLFFLGCFLVACACSNQSNKVWIQNAQKEQLYVQVDGLENAAHHKMAIIQHGLASNMEHGAVQTAKKAFLDNGYVVIAFDSRYSLGEGNNDVEKVRLSTFVADLETVANWAKTQSFYSEPFALAGHSLGGASVIEFSAKYPAQVDILIPITPVISGNLWEKSCMINMADFCNQWQKNKTYQYTDPQNHKTAIIPYDVVTDSKNYNAYAIASQIKAKTLLIAAENDIVINPSDVQKLAKATPDGEYSVVKSSGHNFENQQNKNNLYQIITSFIE